MIRHATSMLLLSAASLVGCDRAPKPDTAGERPHGAAEAAAPSNRVDIPASVRRNLSMTFARVERRNVARTLRVPGAFEWQPTARREYHAPLAGRVELLVEQFQHVESGTPLYSLDAAAWRDLQEQVVAAQAKVDSMGPLRAAHRIHEQSLADKVALWNDRLKQLDELRAAGGGSAAQYTEARATLNATQAELADVMEKDAELQAQQMQAEAELRSLHARRQGLRRAASCPAGHDEAFAVCAAAPGVVETIGLTPGGLAQENSHVLTVVEPNSIRFRAKGLQADLGRLRQGLPARIVPPQGGSIPPQDDMPGLLTLGLTADADERSIDLLVVPSSVSSWAKAGVAAHLEITLDGGVEELAIPLSAVVRDGAAPIVFRRDPANPDKAIRIDADLGLDDGRWIVIASGVKEGDEVVVGGNFQLLLATSGNAAKGGHFHPDGTFHEGED